MYTRVGLARGSYVPELAIVCGILALCVLIAGFTPSRDVNGKWSSSNSLVMQEPRFSTSPGNSDPTSDEWPMFHGALNHTGFTTTTPFQSAGPLWNYPVNVGIVQSSPAITNGRLYEGSTDHKIYCLNATTGAFIWSYTTGDNVYSSPAVTGGRVYVESYDDKLYCLDAVSGASIWNYTTGNVLFSSPSVAGGRVYLGGWDAKLYCLNATTGAFIWSYSTGASIDSSPAIAGGFVYIGSYDHELYCLDAITGAFVWSYSMNSEVCLSSPAVAGGMVYVGNYDGKIYCFNATTGGFAWSYTTGDRVLTSPAIANGRVYAGSMDNKTYCLNATTGNFIWSYTTGNCVYFSSPAIACGRMFIGSNDNDFYCLNATTGALSWYYNTGSPVDSSPAIAGGCVYVGSESTVSCLPIILGTFAPSAPRNLQASSSNGHITITWTLPASNGGSSITSYNIYSGSSSGAESYLTTIGNITTFAQSGLTNGQIYYYQVAAVNSAGEGARSNEASAIPGGVPSAPQSLTATPGNTQVVLNWATPANNGGYAITGYNIYQGTTSNGETLLANLGTVQTYTSMSLTNGQIYYFKISAVNSVGEGAPSSELASTPCVVPTPPQSLTATAGNGQVVLSWVAPVSNGGSPITHYRLYRGTLPGGETIYAVLGVVLTFQDTGVTNGQTYYYEVSAVNAAGESAMIGERSATPCTVPNPPQSLTTTAGNAQIVLNWAAPTSNGGSPITGYNIYRGITSGGETLITTLGPTTYTFTNSGLTNGQMYYFQVSASNAVGNGARSTEVSATPRTVPTAPQSLMSTAGNTQVALSWATPASNGGSAIMYYYIYRGTTSGGETLYTSVGVVLTYTVIGLTNGQVYYFQVSAYNAAGEGPRSSETSAIPATGYSGLKNYTMTANPYSWLDATSGSRCNPSPNLDDGNQLVSLPFTFTFYNTSFTSAYICTNGFINFQTSSTSYSNINFPVSSPVYLIAPYWEDLQASNPCNIFYQSFTSPARFVVEYQNYDTYSLSSLVGTFEIVLYSTGGIVFNYQNIGYYSGATSGLNYGVNMAYYNQYKGLNNSVSNFALLFQQSNVPTTPLNPIATPGNGQVTLTWQAPSSNGGSAITNYKIYRGTASGGEVLVAMLGNVLSWTDTGRTNGQTYYYTISAVNSYGESQQSIEVSATPPGLPYQPLNLIATPGNGLVTLTWQAPSSNGGSAITNYKIYRGTASGGEVLVATLGNVLTWTDTGRTNGQAYYYRISAVNANGEGPMTMESIATPNVNSKDVLVVSHGQSTSYITRNSLTFDSISETAFSTITSATLSQYRILILEPNWNDYNNLRNGLAIVKGYLATAKLVVGIRVAGNMGNQTNIDLLGTFYDRNTPHNAETFVNVNHPFITGAPWSGHLLQTSYFNSWSSTDHGWFINKPTGQSGYAEILCNPDGTSMLEYNYLFGHVVLDTLTSIDGGWGLGNTNVADNYINYLKFVISSNGSVPNAPQNLVAMPGNNQVGLAWQAPAFNGGSAITNYKVYRGTSSGSELLFTTLGNTTFWIDTGRTNGQTYYYRISAVNPNGEGLQSNEASATPPGVPNSPLNLVATSGNGIVMLTWQAPANNGSTAITNYKVYRSTTSGSEVLVTLLGNVLTWTDTNKTNWQTYYYKVSAVNSVGEGPLSNEIQGTPVPRTGTIAILNADGSEQPTYWNGGWSNDPTSIDTGLNAEGFHVIIVNNSAILSGILNTVSVLILIDNVPNQAASAVVQTWWNSGGNIMSFDSSICFLNWAGILPSEAKNTSGYNTYWMYSSPSTGYVVNAFHPVMNGYSNGSTITGASGDAQYLHNAMVGTSASPYYTALVQTSTTSPRNDLVAAYDPPGYGKVVQIWDNTHWVNTALRQMITNALIWMNTSASSFPSAPINLAAASGNGRVVLTWLPPIYNGGSAITSYKVYRGTRSGEEIFLVIVANLTSYTDTSVNNGMVYYYVVCAVNSAGEGLASSETSATPNGSGYYPTEPPINSGLVVTLIIIGLISTISTVGIVRRIKAKQQAPSMASYHPMTMASPRSLQVTPAMGRPAAISRGGNQSPGNVFVSPASVQSPLVASVGRQVGVSPVSRPSDAPALVNNAPVTMPVNHSPVLAEASSVVQGSIITTPEIARPVDIPITRRAREHLPIPDNGESVLFVSQEDLHVPAENGMAMGDKNVSVWCPSCDKLGDAKQVVLDGRITYHCRKCLHPMLVNIECPACFGKISIPQDKIDPASNAVIRCPVCWELACGTR